MVTRLTGSGVTFNDSTSQITQGVEFSSGTLMLFQQSSAPVGWTKQTTHNNKALRVVSGTASSGGSVGFTTAFASGLSAGSTTLSTSQMPSHYHPLPGTGAWCQYGSANGRWPGTEGWGGYDTGPSQVSYAGGNGSHNHALPSFDVQYVDLIIASKD